MRNVLEIVTGAPTDFTDAERSSFMEFVRAGGEVGNQVLERNVTNAKALVFLKQKGLARGIAALKRPLQSYRKRIGKSAKTDIPEARFPYELGYIFIVSEARGQKLSGPLVAKALELVPDSGVFATARTDNHAIRAVLVKVGFEPAGEPYGGNGSRTLQIFVRHA